ncbi:hypothetical protein [Acinetobacter sp. 3657]|uniref:hypothetical protein n=1 Tax=Acinetobacter sp. 3657 TaxID=2817764 RepID=UPI00285B3EB5|nr:hypothetical protein [Prolinoborus sp. 3657]
MKFNFLLMICTAFYSTGSLALPATQETAQAVLKASLFDQTIQYYQNDNIATRYSQAIVQIIPEADLRKDRLLYQKDIAQRFKQEMRSQDFSDYYQRFFTQFYVNFYEEEDLVALLHYSEHPLYQAYLKQVLNIIDEDQKNDYSPEQSTKSAQTEQQVLELLKTLTPK